MFFAFVFNLKQKILEGTKYYQAMFLAVKENQNLSPFYSIPVHFLSFLMCLIQGVVCDNKHIFYPCTFLNEAK